MFEKPSDLFLGRTFEKVLPNPPKTSGGGRFFSFISPISVKYSKASCNLSTTGTFKPSGTGMR
jgi:hypothetical protein